MSLNMFKNENLELELVATKTRVICYWRYDSSVKNAIVQSRNLNLFPELNIPRTTAFYWIKLQINGHSNAHPRVVIEGAWRVNLKSCPLRFLVSYPMSPKALKSLILS